MDVRAAWAQGRTEFTVWFIAASLVGNFLVIRKSTHLRLAESVAADIGMTAMSWLIVCVLPIPVLVHALVQDFLFDGRADPFSWIIPVLMSATIGAMSGLAVLLVFEGRITGSRVARLLLMNLTAVGLAVHRMVAYISAHPPEA